MQSPYHFERERAPAIQNLVHPIAAADEGNEVTRLKPVLIHMILDRLHGVWKIEPIMLPLPGFDQFTSTSRRSPSGVLRLAVIRPSISLRALR